MYRIKPWTNTLIYFLRSIVLVEDGLYNNFISQNSKENPMKVNRKLIFIIVPDLAGHPGCWAG